MTECDAGPRRLLLSGYVPLTDHGFALPCYATGPRPNVWYTATCSIESDHAGTIIGFELFDANEVRQLPRELQKKIAVGDPWQDVFLWQDTEHVGSAAEILSALDSEFPNLIEQAPITLLDLTLSVMGYDAKPLVQASSRYINKRYGAEKAASWLRDTLIRQQIMLVTRRQIAAAGVADQVAPTVGQIAVTDAAGGEFHLMLPKTLSVSLAQAGLLEALVSGYQELANAIGVEIEVPFSDEIRDARAKQEPRIADDKFNEMDRRSHDRLQDILIIVSGSRARSVARHLLSPDWAPVWQQKDVQLNSYVVRRVNEHALEFGSSARPVIDILTERLPFPTLERYGVIVWLADDEMSEDRQLFGLQTEISEWCRRSGTAIPLIALVPPLRDPSRVLLERDPGPQSDLPFRCFIDTTMARSPFWSGNPRRALDRRIADIVTGAAMLCSGDRGLRTYLSNRLPKYEPVLLSFAWETNGRREPQRGMASEASIAGLSKDENSTLFRFHFGVWGERRLDRYRGVGEVRRHRPDFEIFADAVIDYFNQVRAVGQAERYKRSDVPKSVRMTLKHRRLAAAFLLERSAPPFGIIVTAETPALTSLRAAAAAGWSVVRYTDSVSLLEALDGAVWFTGPSLPHEISLPKLQRRVQNRGLATRGLDPRDVIRVPAAQFDAWKLDASNSTLFDAARSYRASIAAEDGVVSEVAIPTTAFAEAMSRGDKAAKSLARFVKDSRQIGKPTRKRLGDLRTAWTEPADGARRFAIEDGLLPVVVAELPRGQVPAQRLFIVDGDGSVPALFTSRLFAVWAQATLSRSTSWSSRFSISGTFETFPIPPLFVVLHEEPQSPPQLRIARNSRLRKLVSALDRDPRILGRQLQNERHPNRSARKRHPLLEALEEELLSAIQLPADASDLDILERLLEMNLKG